MAGLAAVAGHNWPVWLKFRGGQGLATTMGVLAVFSPIPFAISFGIMLLGIVFTSNVRLSSIFGFIIALTLFFLAFFRRRAGLSWGKSAIFTVCGVGFICFLAATLGREFPPGLLQAYVKLPWPLT